MVDRCLRRAASARRLPVPNPTLYRDRATSAEDPIWATLREASEPAGMGTWQRLTGTSLDGTQALRHLLYLHRRAFEAECDGIHRTADFFWREAHARLRRLWQQQGVWDAAASQLATHIDGHQLRALLATELFIDAHVAFANGQLQLESNAVGDRAFVHASHLSDLLALPHEPPLADFDAVVLPAIIAEIDALETARRQTEAIARIRREPRARETPQLGERLAVLQFTHTLGRLAPDPAGVEMSDAEMLRSGIDALSAVHREYPDVLLVFDLLAQLHHLRSVRLANGGRLSEALVECEKSLAHAPGFELAEQAMHQLSESMKLLIGRMAAVADEIRAAPGRTLNAEGLQLKAQAQLGFKPLYEFRQQSGEPERIRTARSLAGAAVVWREIAADRAYTRPSDAQLLALLSVINDLYGQGPEDEQGLAEAYAEAAAGRHHLPPVDAASVARFIAGRRQHDMSPGDGVTAEQAPATVPAEAELDVIAIRPPQATNLGRVPAAHWWLGSQDVGTRALAAVAAACVLGVAIVATVELPLQRARDEAWSQIATADGDPVAVLDAAERFLQSRGLQREDPRRAEVMSAYARAFTQWFGGVERPDADPARMRIARYRQLADAGGVTP